MRRLGCGAATQPTANVRNRQAAKQHTGQNSSGDVAGRINRAALSARAAKRAKHTKLVHPGNDAPVGGINHTRVLPPTLPVPGLDNLRSRAAITKDDLDRFVEPADSAARA